MVADQRYLADIPAEIVDPEWCVWGGTAIDVVATLAVTHFDGSRSNRDRAGVELAISFWARQIGGVDGLA